MELYIVIAIKVVIWFIGGAIIKAMTVSTDPNPGKIRKTIFELGLVVWLVIVFLLPISVYFT